MPTSPFWPNRDRSSDGPMPTTSGGKIRELRIHHSSNQYRILYFFYVRDQIVLVHGFSKKSQQLKERDIELAERRMEDWIRRHPAGN